MQERFYFGDEVLPLFETGIPLLKQRLSQLPDADNVSILHYFNTLSLSVDQLVMSVNVLYFMENSCACYIIFFYSLNFWLLFSGSYCISRWRCMEAIPQAVWSFFTGGSPIGISFINMYLYLFIVFWIFYCGRLYVLRFVKVTRG